MSQATNPRGRGSRLGYFHIDIAEVRTAQGKLYLLVAIDRTSKFAFVEMHEKVARRTAGDFLRHLIAASIIPPRGAPRPAPAQWAALPIDHEEEQGGSRNT